MDFGVCAITKIDDIGLATEAENLGYSHLWVPDSQMIWSDCYAYMALAARETRTIRLGTGSERRGYPQRPGHRPQHRDHQPPRAGAGCSSGSAPGTPRSA